MVCMRYDCYTIVLVTMMFIRGCLLFFFKQKTAYEMRISDWSSDVCSSDLTWSPVLCDIYGIDPAEYVPSYDNYLALVHPEDRVRIEQLVQQIFHTHEDTVYEERIIQPDGEVRHLRSWARLTMNDDGKPVKMIGACLDITERSEEHKSELQS